MLLYLLLLIASLTPGTLQFDCSTDGCANGGVCDAPPRCTCPTDTYGDYCAYIPCVTNPCKAGKCIEDNLRNTHYPIYQICICPPGLMGQNCHEDCPAAVTCSGGQCNAADPGCNCTATVIGSNCEYESCTNGLHAAGDLCWDDYFEALDDCFCAPIFPCSLTPCQNGGTCTDGLYPDYTCACPVGATGVNCEIDTDECVSAPCENGGTCVNDINMYTCMCPPDYIGTHCETNTAPACVSSPCANGGTCTDVARGYTCTCTAGFTGTNCVIALPCVSAHCFNGGTCTNVAGGYTCTCTAGFTGSVCETALVCSSNPCVNGGTCVEATGAYTCTCPSGYSGLQCQTAPSDPCKGFCQNGGTCAVVGGSPTCTCAPGFTGPMCADVVAPPTTEAPPLPLPIITISLTVIGVIIAAVGLLGTCILCCTRQGGGGLKQGLLFPRGRPSLPSPFPDWRLVVLRRKFQASFRPPVYKPSAHAEVYNPYF